MFIDANWQYDSLLFCNTKKYSCLINSCWLFIFQILLYMYMVYRCCMISLNGWTLSMLLLILRMYYIIGYSGEAYLKRLDLQF